MSDRFLIMLKANELSAYCLPTVCVNNRFNAAYFLWHQLFFNYFLDDTFSAA
jgi:hypothetical protein